MRYPIKTCVICSEQFELRPDKPGFANRCPSCTEEEAEKATQRPTGEESDRERDAARRQAMRDLLYRKDS